MIQPSNNLFAAGARMVHEEAVELTLASLRAYWDRHNHIAIAWSGGKDSTSTLTLLVHLIEVGELPKPDRLYVFYADTRQELPPLQAAADAIVAKLRERAWIEVIVVCAPLDKRFMVYILGRGVPPPNNNTLRWCTRQIKVDPMSAALYFSRTTFPPAFGKYLISGVVEAATAEDAIANLDLSLRGAKSRDSAQSFHFMDLDTASRANARGILAVTTAEEG
jgi:DNA sulfur modification protein DndC